MTQPPRSESPQDSRSTAGDTGYSGDIVSAGNAADPADYFALLKPRVMWLVVFTAAVGMIASPAEFNPVVYGIALLCIAGGAGAAGCLNMWYEADIDAVMVRTQNRPIPSGKVGRESALAFGVILAFASVSTLALTSGVIPAALLGFTIFYYLVIYTMWLKPTSEQNVVLGGVAGSLPPVVGWVATGAPLFAPLPWMMFLLIFLWTPPHSWALALWRKSDYSAVGIPMMPSSEGGIARSCRWSLFYCALLLLLAVSAWVFGIGGSAFFHLANIGGVAWLSYRAWVMLVRWRAPEQSGKQGSKDAVIASRAYFRDSIYYMVGIFLALAIDSLLFA